MAVIKIKKDNDWITLPSLIGGGNNIIQENTNNNVAIHIGEEPPTDESNFWLDTDDDIDSISDIYTLKLGTEIPSGADLNDYRKPGNYFTPNQAVTQSLVNKPDIGTNDLNVGVLVDIRQVAETVYMQMITVPGYGSRYTRRLVNGAWEKGWNYVGGIDSIAAEGVSNEWSYIKYVNGLCDCSKKITITTTATDWVSYGNGNLHQYLDSGNALPFAINNPKFSVVTSAGAVGSQIYSNNANSVRLRHFNAGAFATTTDIFIRVTGNWK